MIELRDYLATRRTVPAQFLGEPGPDEAGLTDMLTLAVRTPDHGKLAPWRFIVLRGAARERAGAAIAAVAERKGLGAGEETERTRFTRAPVVVAVVSTAAAHPKIPEWEQVLSAGAVCMNLLHAAAAHGFRAQWITEWMSYDADARAALGLAESERLAGFIHIGSTDMPPSERARPDLAALVTHYG